MKILGIETSCDETAAAVVEDLPAGRQVGIKILSNVVASSSDMHIKTGGIIPEQAARQQIRSIIPVISEALSQAFPNLPTTNYQLLATYIDAIAVTVGPGLIGSLLVGVETAKTLSFIWKKPIVPVNHLVGHIYANWIETEELKNEKTKEPKNRKTNHSPSQGLSRAGGQSPITDHITPQFPALALVVSGGHTDLVLMKNYGKIEWIGGTRDDAAGEAFDKCARLLGLPYPGGPVISNEAEKYLDKNSSTKLNLFPRPMLDNFSAKSIKHLGGPATMSQRALGWDWSFSGLKTAVLRETEKLKDQKIKQSLSHRDKKLSAKEVSWLSAEIQEAIVDCLVEKSIRAIKKFKPRSFLLAGGVAANKRLREKFKSRIKAEILQVYFHVPPINLCTDNATSIASCAFYNLHPVDWKKISADPGLTIVGEV